MIKVIVHPKEASILGLYLIGRKPSSTLRERYYHAVRSKELIIPESEQKLWQMMLKKHWTIGPIDAALATKHRDSVIRKRLVVLLAILEATPGYSHYFLPEPSSKLRLIGLGFKAYRKVIWGRMVGSILLKLYRGK